MKRTVMTGCAAVVFALLAGPAGAQQYRFDVGIDGGFAYFTSSLTEDHGLVGDDASFNTGWITGFEATGWLNDNFGIRFDLGYTEKSFEQGDRTMLEDINLWDLAGSLVWRFAGPTQGEFIGIEMMPYLFGGAGVKISDPATEGPRHAMRAVTETGDQTFFMAGETQLAGRLGVGADIRMHRSLILRLEAGDIIFDSPTYDDATADEDVGKVVHELYATLGLAVPFGFIIPPPVAVVAPPPPPPAPAPREERVTVCVIDPNSPTGVRTVQAIYLVDEGDTVVVQGDRRVALRTTTGNVVVAPDASWYVAGEPLVFLDDGTVRTEFVSYGGARVIPSGSLAYLGTQNGIAVYADADDVADVREQWNELRDANRDGDLDDILENRAELTEEFGEIEFLYVPMDPVGCVFQALQRVEEVRKAD
ncbi:MAG TPA: outer membrane beta-barrel protein [Longimicrobiales bacterium]|nr:outer membrane beta-barrel protein [Longimicrobiales bacterium]